MTDAGKMTVKEQAWKNLLDFKKVLDKLGIPFCLAHGTLLGAYRDGDFISGDEDDIDLVIPDLYADEAEKIFSELQKIGFNKPGRFWIKGRLEGAGIYRGANRIDLNFLHEKEDKVYEVHINKFPNNPKSYMVYVFPIRHFEKFDKLNFKGIDFNIPFDVERFLELKYGPDWRVPISKDSWYGGKNLDPNIDKTLKSDYEI